MDAQQFCLKWDGFQGTVTSLFDQLRHDGELVDITLCCDGQRVRAHRMMLSACSPYFRQLIQENPCQQLVFFLKDTSSTDLRAIIEFIYKGSVNVAQSQLASFIKTAETLQIRGLSGDDDTKPLAPSQTTPARSPAAKRRRLSEHDAPAAAAAAPAPSAVPAPSPGSRPAESPGHAGPSEPSAPPAPPPVSSSASLPPPPLAAPAPAPLQTPASSVPPSAPPAAQLPLPPPPPAAMDAIDPMVKVEKVDTMEEDVTALDDTLGYVAEYEGGAYQSRAPLDPLTIEQMAGALVPGPSQRLAEDGSSQAVYTCEHCERTFLSRSSLRNHAKQHLGRTQCPLCQGVYASVPTLRRHLLSIHGQTAQQVYAMVPSETRGRRSLPVPTAPPAGTVAMPANASAGGGAY